MNSSWESQVLSFRLSGLESHAPDSKLDRSGQGRSLNVIDFDGLVP